MKFTILALCLFSVAVPVAQAQLEIYKPPRYNWYRPRRVTQPRTNRNGTKNPSFVPVVLTPQEQAAKDVIDRMGEELNRANGIQFTGTITYSAEVDGNIKSITANAVTLLQRPAQVLIQVADRNQQPEGVISDDGNKYTLYDSTAEKYINVSISPDLYSFEQALNISGKAVYPKLSQSGRDLRAAIGFPLIFFDKVYDESEVKRGETLSYSTVASTSADGKPVVLATETLTAANKNTLAATYMIDSKTNLPISFTQIETKLNQSPVTDLQENFTSLKVIRTTLPMSTFDTTIPTTARLVSTAP